MNNHIILDTLNYLQEEDGEEEEQILMEEDALLVHFFKENLEQDELEEEMFYALCFEFPVIVAQYSIEFLQDIYGASPMIYFSRERRKKCDRMDFTEQFWLQKHPSLEDPTPENPFPSFSFRDHYRIKRSTFNQVVNYCMRSKEYVGAILHGGIPVEIQVAVVFWRFANCHLGYRIAEMTMGVSAGSFCQLTRRFLNAMLGLSASIINWPINDPTRAADIVQGFATGPNTRLSNVIGAIDGKNVVIQKPSVRGNDYIDRKGRATINMMAICDDKGKFMYLRLGVSGITTNELCYCYSFN